MERVSNKEFQKVKQEAQHKELVKGLEKIYQKIDESRDNSELINSLNEGLSELKVAINQIDLSVEVKETTVELNQTDVINQLKVYTEQVKESTIDIYTGLREKLEKLINKIEKRPTEWTFKVKRDNIGYIEEVKAIGK